MSHLPTSFLLSSSGLYYWLKDRVNAACKRIHRGKKRYQTDPTLSPHLSVKVFPSLWCDLFSLSALSLRLVVVYREEPTQLSRLLSHGSVGLPEEPVHPAVADGLCVCGERPHHKLHSALHLHPLADQQAAIS